ncbi:MAG TPA: SUF system NifU family Fe-S cluster assembly protein [Gemmatimonadales bacterium]
MTDLSELYQQVILDHNRTPRNFRVLDDANHTAHGDNPLCGDKIKLYAKVDHGVIRDIGFQGSGCAISRASASLMTAAVKGRTVTEAEELFAAFHEMVAGDAGQPMPAESLGKLRAFAGVKEFPARVKCANLPWHTLHAALAGAEDGVTTE